jgi:hypothetical protein
MPNDLTDEKIIDGIYDYVDSAMTRGDWKSLDYIFYKMLSHVHEMNLTIIMTYVVASLPGADKIKNRKEFIIKAKELHPGEKLWVNL